MTRVALPADLPRAAAEPGDWGACQALLTLRMTSVERRGWTEGRNGQTADIITEHVKGNVQHR